MCGIAGIYSFMRDLKIDINLLQEMTQRIRHRGPNDEGFMLIDSRDGGFRSFCGSDSAQAVKKSYPACDPGCAARLGFGFRRLPTLELSESGHQPMTDAELGLAIIFNGEIYNHRQLRRDLEALNYRFFSHSDTEVILKAYHAWGEDCVHRFNGMWAFSIWDAHRQSLFLSRDRFGIKPLYYAHDRDFFYWASEIKQILAAPIDRDQNKAMIWRSMKVNAMIVYDDETYWHSVKALKPGHNILLDSSGMQIKEYYSLDPNTFQSSKLSFDKATARYRELFLESLNLQLQSDVEVAASLSGGLDSGAIVSMTAPRLDYLLRTFSTYYDADPALDERAYIEIIAANSNIQTNYIAPTAQNALDWWEKASYLNDLPIGSGFVSQYALMKSVHEAGIRVLLSGQGSDEMSAGYRHAVYRYYADLLRGMKLGRFGREIRHLLREDPLSSISNLGKITLSAAMPESRLYLLEAQRYRFEAFNEDFYTEAVLDADGKLMGKISDVKGSRLSSFLLNMMHNTSLGTLLHFEDRMSMAHSVESRVPFLDHRLVEFVFSLPSEYKIRPPLRKVIHRAALRDYVPKEISMRRDKGIFGSPFHSTWMRGELKPYIRDILFSTEFRSRGIWNLPLIHERWQKFVAGRNEDAEMLYNVVSLELWHRAFAG